MRRDFRVGVSTKKISCCYRCEDRKVGCHGTCEEYKKEKAERFEEYERWLEWDKKYSVQTKMEVDRAHSKRKHFQNKLVKRK